MYTLKVKTIKYDRQPGDEAVILTSYLSDGSTLVPIEGNGTAIKYFNIRIPKSGLPISGYLAHLEALAAVAISDAFDFSFTTEIEDGQEELTLLTSDVSRLLIGMAITGPGTDTTLKTILSSTKVLLDDQVELSYTGNLIAPSVTLTGSITTASYTVTGLSSTASLSSGMAVSGTGLPSGTFISAILSLTSVSLTQAALLTQSSSLTFSPVANADVISSISPAALDESFVGLTISGASVPDSTTIEEVLSSSSIRMSALSETQATGEALLINGTAELLASMTGVTIDDSDLQRVVDIINFDEI